MAVEIPRYPGGPEQGVTLRVLPEEAHAFANAADLATMEWKPRLEALTP